MKRRLLSLVVILALFGFWELACVWWRVSSLVLPRPSAAIVAMFEQAPAIAPHAAQTLMTTLLGFALGVVVGFALGVLIGAFPLAYDALYPLLIGFSSVPKVALVPILVLWLGAGTWPAVLTAMSMCVFPIVVNVATGVAGAEPELRDVLKTLRASRWETLWNVGLPRAMPYFFASLKVAISLAFVGSVVSETVASNRGIGNLMMIASSDFDTPLLFAGLFILAALGVGLYAVFAALERRVTFWAQRGGGDL